MNRTRARTSALLSAAALMTPVVMSTAASAEPAATPKIEETVVTARRREEDVQDVPAVVSVFNEEKVFLAGTNSMEQLRDQVPNFNFASDMAYRSRVSVRGLGSDRSGTQTNGVGFFIDGVYQNGTSRFNAPFFDIERIEVLKGPQGARYGRNAFAGVVNVVTRKPNDEFRFSMQGTAENFGTYNYAGLISGPIIEGTLFGKISAAHNQSDGEWQNDVSGKDQNPSSSNFIDGRLVWRATEDLEFDLTIGKSDNNGIAYAFSQVKSLQNLSENYLVRDDSRSGADYTDYTLATTWDFDGFQIINHLSMYDYLNHLAVDGDVTPYNGTFSVVKVDGKQKADDFRVQSTGTGAWTWMFGGEYVKGEADAFFPTYFLDEVDLALLGVRNDAYRALLMSISPSVNTIKSESKIWSVFGEVSYLLNQNVEFLASVRYDDIDNEVFNAAGGGRSKGFEDQKLQPLFSVRYTFDDITSFYVSAAKGVRQGGFNSSALSKSYATFETDEVWNYEVGMKRTLPDLGGRLNISLFYSDAQVLNQAAIIRTDAGSLANGALTVGSARSFGMDAEFAMQINDNLDWSMGLGYLHCRLRDVPDRASLPEDLQNALGGGVKNGNECQDSSAWSFNGTLNAEYPLESQGLTAIGSLAMTFKGPTRLTSDELSRHREEIQEPVYLFNVTAGLRNEHITALAYVNNLTNQRYALDHFSAENLRKSSILGAVDYITTLAPRRHYGVKVRYDF